MIDDLNFQYMAIAYLFPGQGSQFSGMAKPLYERSSEARDLLEQANGILGFRITDIMFEGSDEDLRATRVTQPAIFLHSVVLARCSGLPQPDMVAGHSLGEFSALTAAGAMSFEDGLRLVAVRAREMQRCCTAVPGTMAAVIGLPDEDVEMVCEGCGGIVVPANYNCTGQVVISGEDAAVREACQKLKAAGAKRALPLSVGGAFHSPLMEPAREALGEAIEATPFRTPRCPIYQNVSALPSTDPATIKANLLQQLTSPVRWTQTVQNMLSDGATRFVELGPGSVLQGLVKRIATGQDILIEGIQ
jgi:[acyl-carrier-protein] S-malonyltransferase